MTFCPAHAVTPVESSDSLTMNSAAMNEANSPEVSRDAEISRLPYHNAAATATPPSNSMSGGRAAIAPVTFILIRNKRCDASRNRPTSYASALKALTMRWPVNASAVMCDRCSSSS